MAQSPRSLTDIAHRLTKISKVTTAAQAKNKADKTSKFAKPARKIKPLAARKGLTIDELIKFANPDRVSNARRDQVTIVSFRVGGKPAGTKIFSKTMTYDNEVSPPQVRPHKHWIAKVEEDQHLKFNSAKVLAHCDCEDFKFVFEYALTHHGASTIKFSNGDPPVVKNPRLYPGICKHLWVLGKYLQKTKI